MVDQGAGAALQYPPKGTSLSPTKMGEQNSAALTTCSIMGVRASCAALAVLQENPGIVLTPNKVQKESEKLRMGWEQAPKFTFL